MRLAPPNVQRMLRGGGPKNDSQAEVRAVPAVLEEKGQVGQAKESRDVREQASGREARARRSVLQAALSASHSSSTVWNSPAGSYARRTSASRARAAGAKERLARAASPITSDSPA